MWTNLALLLLRLVVGALFVGHGTQKAFGWFGGHGIAGTAGFMEQLGLKPGRLHATAAAFGETVGGLLVLSGLWTPVGAALIVAVMLVGSRPCTSPRASGIPTAATSTPSR